MNWALRTDGVGKAFRGRPVLNEITWSVPQGSLYGLIGANGAGKTTLLRIALGLLMPDRGTVEVLGMRLSRENAWIRERVHYVASERAMAPSFRVEEWLRYASLAYPHWDRVRAKRLTEALELPYDRLLGELSSGQRTGFQMAIAAAASPDLLLLDEPTNGLDVVVKTQVLQLVVDMAASTGMTVILASHRIEDVERLADRVAVLYDGRFVVEDEIDHLKSRLHRLQVVIPGEWPEDLTQDPRVLRVDRQGKAAMITVEGPSEPFAARCRNAGAILVEPVDLDLAEVFQVFLAKEGYSRARLQWNLP